MLLKATLALEHRVAALFEGRSGGFAKFLRFFSAWLILFGSKFVMLGAINFAFGDAVLFSGPLHGVLAFIAGLFLNCVSSARSGLIEVSP